MIDFKALKRKHFKYFHTINSRWSDNDIYGHVNNIVYYSYFDSAVNHYLIQQGKLDIHNGPIVGFVVNSTCTYLQALAFPDNIEVGLSVIKIGNTSVTYSLGVYKEGGEELHAYGEFVHVFVDRKVNKSVPIPEKIRLALEHLFVMT